ADLVSLVRVLYDHDDPAVLGLLRNAHAAMNKGDTLLVAEPFATEQHERRITDAYFEFYLLAMGSGRPRTPREITGLLKEAGFQRVRFPRTRRPMLTGLAVAEA
ncbi:MAG: methyltransferase, partial [Pseudomonadota bacterium]